MRSYLLKEEEEEEEEAGLSKVNSQSLQRSLLHFTNLLRLNNTVVLLYLHFLLKMAKHISAVH